MSKIFTAKRYFLAQFRRYINNDNKVLVHNLFAGTRELLSDYIQIHNDVIENIENNKFKRARADLLECMKYFLKESIFYKESLYKCEIDTLIRSIDKCSDKELISYVKINNMCTSFLKKLNNENIYEYIIENIKITSNFAEIDKLLNLLIIELLYDGYSIKYLSEWYKENIVTEKNINKENIDSILDNFKKLKRCKMQYTYYLALNESVYKLEDQCYIGLNIKLERVSEEYNSDLWKFILQGKNLNIYKIQIEAMDIYKGLEIIKNAFESYFQIINNLLDDKNGIKMTNKCIVKIDDDTYRKLRIENYDEDTLFSGLQSREKQEIKDFIKYRDKVYRTMENVDEIDNIQRAINIVNSQRNQSKENRLINLWSVLEYILTFNEGTSIIGNVKDVIPKVVCLYSIKDKINMFWNQLYKYKKSDIEIVNSFITECIKDDDEYEYDIEKIINYINTNGSSLINKFEFNSALQRSIGEIGELLHNSERRVKYIEKLSKEVEYDITRIYRTRNILIHSSKNDIDNIDYKSLRLHKYNSQMLAVIIYYKSKNPYLTITEILSSIEHTYNEYMNVIKEKDIDQLKICKPRYLFI